MSRLFFWLALATLSACQPGYHLTSQTASRPEVDSATAVADSSMARFLAPYRQKLDQSMNEVLAHSTGPIEKAQPDGPLNNLLTDALLQETTRYYGKPIDCSHLNYYGIRASLPKGNITTGSIFEVMPFDNKLVIITLTGTMLQQLLNHFAKGNELIMGGLRTKIHDGQAHDIQFTNGRTLQPADTYTIVLSDYVANEENNAVFLQNPVKRENTNYLVRDALIDYFRRQGQTGQPINPVSDGRISLD